MSKANKNVTLAYDSGGNLIAWNRKDNVAMGQHHSFMFKVYVDEEDVEVSLSLWRLVYLCGG